MDANENFVELAEEDLSAPLTLQLFIKFCHTDQYAQLVKDIVDNMIKPLEHKISIAQS